MTNRLYEVPFLVTLKGTAYIEAADIDAAMDAVRDELYFDADAVDLALRPSTNANGEVDDGMTATVEVSRAVESTADPKVIFAVDPSEPDDEPLDEPTPGPVPVHPIDAINKATEPQPTPPPKAPKSGLK